jgi:hypothetical protein
LRCRPSPPGKYTREEFTGGMRKMGVDSIEKLKAKLPALRQELADEAKFKQVYEYCFDFSKELNQKSLPLETAVALWQGWIPLFTTRVILQSQTNHGSFDE